MTEILHASKKKMKFSMVPVEKKKHFLELKNFKNKIK